MEMMSRFARGFGVCAAVFLGATAHAGDTEVVIETPDESVTLAGTVSMPEDVERDARVAGVVFFTGSGPQDRDSTILGQKPHKVMADELVARGFAVLRCDDRGVGGSTGDRAEATLDDFVEDGRAMVRFLAGFEGVDPERVFVLGHSEGAGVAARLASEDEPIVGAVLLGGSSVAGHLVLTDQAVRALEAEGIVDRSEAVRTAHGTLMRAVLDGAPREELVDLTIALITAQAGSELPEALVRPQAEQAAGQLGSSWFRHFLAHDPGTSIRAMRVPTLALFGGLDFQVSAALNAGPMTEALGATDEAMSRVVVMPRHNHLFQIAQTGAMSEYARLDDLDPKVAHAIADWMDDVLASRDR